MADEFVTLTDQDEEPIQELDVFLMRHAQSLGNVFPRQGPFGPVDPQLTETGRDQATQASRCIANSSNYGPSSVFSSGLVRTHETALLAFPDQQHIYVAPHVCETKNAERVMHPSSTPRAPEQQRQQCKKDLGEETCAKMSYELLAPSEIGCVEPNWDQFLGWLLRQEKIQQLVAANATWRNRSPRPRIALVSHGNFLWKMFKEHGFSYGHPRNAEVYLARLPMRLSRDGMAVDSFGDLEMRGVVCGGFKSQSLKWMWRSVHCTVICLLIAAILAVLRCTRRSPSRDEARGRLPGEIAVEMRQSM